MDNCCLLYLVPIFFISCAYAEESKTKQFILDSEYIVQITCDSGTNLVKNGKIVFSLEEIKYCEGDDKHFVISFDDNLFNTGKKGIHISPSYIQSSASKIVYVIDTESNKFVLAGSLPIFADQQDDGTILHEILDHQNKWRLVYYFSDNKIFNQKTTALYFDGNICIYKPDELNNRPYVRSDCSDGIIASPNAPVCILYTNETPEIIPLEKCDIKQEEVSNIQK